MKEWFVKFASDHWQVVCLFSLFLLLWMGHAAMIHWNRSAEQIKWCEEMIMMSFTAMLAKFKD